MAVPNIDDKGRIVGWIETSPEVYRAPVASRKAFDAHVREAEQRFQARYDALCGPVTVIHP